MCYDMFMTTQSLPQMTEAAYVKVRDAFRRSLPGKVTTTWVTANIDGYRTEASARSLLSNLRQFGLITDDGTPTDVARQWRADESYAAACEVMLRTAFPADLVDAVSGGIPPADVMQNLFLSRGVGLGSAKNVTRIFRLIASKDIPTGRTRPTSNDGAVKKGAGTRKSRSSAGREAEVHRRETSHTTPPGPEAAVTVLRYFLDRGRLAELRVPPDLDDREKRRLFAHLKIDLLDQVSD